MVSLKSEEEIELMKESNRIVSDTLRLLGAHIAPGIETLALDRMAEDFIRSCGAVPAFKGYGGNGRTPAYPATLCVSINEAVVHGIPSRRRLAEGDIVSIDVGTRKNGWFGDGAWTFTVGAVSSVKQRLLDVTRESLFRGIEQARVGNRLYDISYAVQTHVEQHGFSVVRSLVGHGIGRDLHEEPQVPNFGRARTGMKLKAGMTLAIEPMVNMGNAEVVVGEDHWTVQTADGLPSAHFEHTVYISRNGPVLLTNHFVEEYA